MTALPSLIFLNPSGLLIPIFSRITQRCVEVVTVKSFRHMPA